MSNKIIHYNRRLEECKGCHKCTIERYIADVLSQYEDEVFITYINSAYKVVCYCIEDEIDRRYYELMTFKLAKAVISYYISTDIVNYFIDHQYSDKLESEELHMFLNC